MSTIGVNKPKIKLQSYTPPTLDGKLQPQAVELEEAVLGAMMLEKEALSTVIDILKPEAFYRPAHQSIYRAIVDLFNESEPVDILTVTNKLKKNGITLISFPLLSILLKYARTTRSRNHQTRS